MMRKIADTTDRNYWLFVLAIALFVLLTYLPHLGSYPLWDPWETQYAQVAHEMVQQTEKGRDIYYIKPHYRHSDKWLSKPIFHLWLMNISFRLLGENAFTARLPEVLMSLLALLFVFFAVAKLWNRRAALISALILGTSPMFFLIGRSNIVDMPYLAWQVGAISFLMVGLFGDERKEAKYIYWFYFFSAFALLTKGLLSIVIPGVIIFGYILTTWDWQLLRRLRLVRGIAIYLIVGFPWFFFMMLSYGPLYYLKVFFWYHHFRRYAGDIKKPNGSFDMYVKVFAFANFPWSAFLPAAVVDMARRMKGWHALRSKEFFLFMSMLMPYIFMSYGSTKFNHYIFPSVPFAAMLVGVYVDKWIERMDGYAARFELMISMLFFGLLAKDVVTYKKLILNLFIYYYDRPVSAAVNPWWEYSIIFWMGFAVLAMLWLRPYIKSLSRLTFSALVAMLVLMLAGNVAGIVSAYHAHNVHMVKGLYVAMAATGAAIVSAIGIRWLPKRIGTISAVGVFWLLSVAFMFTVNYKLVAPLSDYFSTQSLYEAYDKLSPNHEPICEYHAWRRRSVSYFWDNKYTYIPSNKPADSKIKRFFGQHRKVFCLVDHGNFERLRKKVKRLVGKDLFIVYREHPFTYIVSTKEPPDFKAKLGDVLLSSLPQVDVPMNVRFEAGITLLGCNISPRVVKRGQKVKLECFFKCERKIDDDYMIFVHAESDADTGRIVGDHLPADGIYPTDKWKPGDIIKDTWSRTIPSSIKGKKLKFYIGFFKDNYRMPVVSYPRPSDNRVFVGEVELK